MIKTKRNKPAQRKIGSVIHITTVRYLKGGDGGVGGGGEALIHMPIIANRKPSMETHLDPQWKAVTVELWVSFIRNNIPSILYKASLPNKNAIS